MDKVVFYVTLLDRNTGNRRTERVTTCKSFTEAETKITHDERFNFDPRFEEMISIVKGDYTV